MTHSYQIFDVFASAPLEGNPLAVVYDAGDLPGEAMQAIAKAFNLSETIFLMPPEDAANTHKARIFTPTMEMPFAGHPTVGGAVAAARRAGGLATVSLELPAGVTRCTIAPDASGATVVAPQIPALEDGVVSTSVLAGVLGLDEAELGFGAYKPVRATSGPRWTVTPVASADRLAAIRLDTNAIKALGAGYESLYVIAPTGEGAFQCRMFAPEHNIYEDPATGSAAVAFAALFAQWGGAGDGTHELTFLQGVEMGHRAVLRLGIDIADGAVTEVRLSGDVVLMAEGTMVF
ncbi:PhzF family phenazine biosynthesis protein [Acuticoccus sp. MNP-M23]|uniref:PhzF family phenazine biosynthesis protein n=1 Tax=Acuticoccus sp. MNP-M23 TaxID=3072793 RepID=UPI0028164FA5|nr:PhzF family phenazine biosynthesis protein [Acuticoccus sp. MNP-M23]WMS43701.1 PhzF family phenazine biosynthesis protein [Acuticoccus sp. MNP-M23]